MDGVETIIEALHTHSTRLAALCNMERPELLLPERVENYRNALEELYQSLQRRTCASSITDL